jgi:hypothetical protein
VALPPLPKALRSFGAPNPAEGYRRIDEWANGTQDLLQGLRDGNPAVLRRLAVLEAGGGGGGVTDHGALTGLADDDHTQYLLADGSRDLAGDWSAGSNKITDLAAPTNPNDAARLADVGGGSTVDVWMPDAVPASPHVDDDECDTGSIDGAWTVWDEDGYQTESASSSRRCYEITGTGNGTLRWGGLYKAIPDSEFQVTAKVSFETAAANSVATGIFVGDLTTPSTGPIHTVFSTHANNINEIRTSRFTYADYNGGSSQGSSGSSNHALYLRLRVNGTSISADCSPDGLNWRQVETSGTITFAVSPVHVGFCHHVGSAAAPGTGRLHWIRFLSGAGSSAFDYAIPGRVVSVQV